MYIANFKLFAACLLSFSLLFFTSCEQEEEVTPMNIVETAQQNDELTSLVEALTDPRHTTDFAALLSGTDNYTTFAPNNAAFQALLDTDPSWNTIGDIPIATLDAVLKYHVINGANVQADELTDGQVVATLQGNNLTVDLSAGAKLMTTSNQTVTIEATDVQGSNGVVHVINTVMLP